MSLKLLKILARAGYAPLIIATLVFSFWGIGAGSELLSPLLMQHRGAALWVLPLCIGLYVATLQQLYAGLEPNERLWPTLLFLGLCAQLLAASSGALMFAQQYTDWTQVVVPLVCIVFAFVATVGLLEAGVVLAAYTISKAVADRAGATYRYGAYLRRLVREDRARLARTGC
jgi:hypothetical protein